MEMKAGESSRLEQKSIHEKIKISDSAEKSYQSTQMENYDRRKDSMSNELADIKPVELNTLSKEYQDRTQAEGISEQDFNKYDSLRRAFELLARLKSLSEPDAELERAAKNMVFELADAADAYIGKVNEKIASALFYLNEAVYNLAQAKFPEELKKQEERRAKQNEAYIKDARERLSKMKVS